jgi:hypothetical protein
VTDGSHRRLLGFVGLGFALTGTLTLLISPIAMPEEAAAVAAHYSDNRTALILTSIVVVGGSALMAAWYVVVAAFLARTPGAALLVRIGVVGMAVQIAALSVGFTVFAAVAYREPDPDTAQLATDVGWLLISLAGGPVTTVAIIAFAIALRREGFGGTWLLPASAVAAVAHLVVASSFAESGFFSPVGGVEIVVPLVYQAWIAALGVALVRGRRGGGSSSIGGIGSKAVVGSTSIVRSSSS